MSSDPATPLPGDELRVDRRIYHHHGFCLGDGMVLQSGGCVKDKPRASIHHVPLAEFATGAPVQVVKQENPDRAAAVRRGLWLLANPPPVTYHLFGHNCEHVARWCATGKVESSQARNALAFNSIAGSAILFLEHPGGWLLGIVQLLLGLLLAWLSRGPNARFERHIRENWPG
ncbi:MAG TPA: lecithin retinol acyltransferase family protein [Solirubrobacteraceae bacterium]|jgi:hypothetical protein|nr:lecithin retinol acyltransferase family protein [Solirubrobacteraceae bacterium]